MSEVPTLSVDRPVWYDRKRMLQLIAFVASLVGAAFALLAPAYNSVSESSNSSGDVSTVVSAQTLLEVNGPTVIGLVLVPVILTGVPLLLYGRARMPVSIVAAVILVGFVVISGATIGLFFFVSAISAVVALFLPVRSHKV